jgi:hypothetical protein
VFAWKCVQYRGVPSTRVITILVALNVICKVLHLLIAHKPSVYLHHYNTIMVQGRCMKMAGHLALQALLLSTEVTEASPTLFRDAFVTTLAGLLVVAPVADPMHWGSNLAAQLIMLCVIVSRHDLLGRLWFELQDNGSRSLSARPSFPRIYVRVSRQSPSLRQQKLYPTL